MIHSNPIAALILKGIIMSKIKLNINPEHLATLAARIYKGNATEAVNEALFLILSSYVKANEHNGCEDPKEQV